jgi:hypothetical protein
LGFALLVDILQMKMQKTKTKPVQTQEHYLPKEVNKENNP